MRISVVCQQPMPLALLPCGAVAGHAAQESGCSDCQLLTLAPTKVWAARQAAHLVITGKGWLGQILRRYLKILPVTQVTAPGSGANLVALLPRERLRAFQPTLENPPNRELTIVHVGCFTARHGAKPLINAVAQIRQHGVGVRLLFIGTGPELGDVGELVMDRNLESHVEFGSALSTSELATLLADADIGASLYGEPSEQPDFEILDYKAAGLPVITTEYATMDPTIMVRQGENGWIVPPYDVDTLVAAILWAAGHPEQRRKMGQAGRLEAEAWFEWDRSSAGLEPVVSQRLDTARP